MKNICQIFLPIKSFLHKKHVDILTEKWFTPSRMLERKFNNLMTFRPAIEAVSPEAYYQANGYDGPGQADGVESSDSDDGEQSGSDAGHYSGDESDDEVEVLSGGARVDPRDEQVCSLSIKGRP